MENLYTVGKSDTIQNNTVLSKLCVECLISGVRKHLKCNENKSITSISEDSAPKTLSENITVANT